MRRRGRGRPRQHGDPEHPAPALPAGPDRARPRPHRMNEMKACDHLPTHLGRGALHTRRPPPRHVSLAAPSRRYPGKQANVSVSPTPKRKPNLRLKAGTPGSSQGSRSYSGAEETAESWGSGHTPAVSRQTTPAFAPEPRRTGPDFLPELCSQPGAWVSRPVGLALDRRH